MGERPLQGYSSTNLAKYEELWFEDGNVVIQTENTLFKVHRGILCAQSSVFADMFSFPQSVQQDEQYEGCPLVCLYDSAEELALFLKGVLDSKTFSSQDKPTYKQVIAFVRLGTKYDIPHITAYGLRILRQAYPLSLDQLDTSQTARPFAGISTDSEIFAVINLARELGILDILPASFARASGLNLYPIVHGTAAGVQLSEEDKFICMDGRELILNHKWHIYGFLADPECSVDLPCNTIRLRYLDMIMGSSLHPLEKLVAKGLCMKCSGEWRGRMDERRRKLWDLIPNLFRLPSWDVLREMKERDEMVSRAT